MLIMYSKEIELCPDAQDGPAPLAPGPRGRGGPCRRSLAAAGGGAMWPAGSISGAEGSRGPPRPRGPGARGAGPCVGCLSAACPQLSARSPLAPGPCSSIVI